MNHALLFGVHNMMPHRFLGPHRIASYLREHEWDVEVIDFASYWSLEQLKELAKSRITSSTKFFGFGSWFGTWNPHIDEFCVWVKSNYPSINVVYGSHTHPRFTSKGVDYYIVGYGEKAIIELVQSFAGNTKVAFDPRWFGDKKLIVANETYPAFPMNSLRVIYEDRDYIESWEWLTTEMTRGCKFSCSFCNFPILGVKEDHSRVADDFEYQMRDTYDRFGVKNYYVADETANQDKENLEKFASVADTLSFDLRMHGFIRADLLIANKDTWDPLVRLGFFGQMYGIETFNKKAGAAIGKGMDPDKVKAGLLEVRDFFNKDQQYSGYINLVCGLPHETKESWADGVKWMADNWCSQGEVAGYYALEIPLDPMDGKLSFISKNWQKLGYREAVSTQAKKHSVGSLKYAEALMNWENDNMSLEWAVNAANQAYADTKHNMGVSIWHWGDYGLLTDDLAKIKTFKKHTKMSPNGEVEAFIQRYIHKKLSI